MKVLLVAAGLPFPMDTGGKIRTVHTLRLLNELHTVTMVTLVPRGTEAASVEQTRQWVGELIQIPWRERAKRTPAFYGELLSNLPSRLPYVIAKHVSHEMEQRLADLERSGDYDALICDFLFPAANTLHLSLRPRILFQHNVETRIWDRYVANETSPLRRLYFASQRRRLARFERLACSGYDHCIAVSDEDAADMARRFGARAVSVVPTGVDLDHYAPRATRAEDIVFVGSMDWMPNQDAVRYFINEVLPMIRRRVPNAHFTVVGRSVPRDIARLAERIRNVEVTGFVPDVRPYYERAAAVVVPLRVGGGTRIKIYEAMAMGRAVVSTSVGMEGLPVSPGRDLLAADTPEELARAVAEMLTNAESRRRYETAARAFAEANCSWDHAAKRFLEAVVGIVAEHNGAAAVGARG